MPPERAWFSNRKLFFVAVLILIVTIVATCIYASNCGCDELEIKKLNDKIAFLEQENEQLRIDCKSQIDQLEMNLQNVNTELSIINPQLSNTNMNYNTCQAQQEYFRHQYETEKKEKEMYRNRVDNMTEEMYLLRLEHLHQLQSKGQNLTTCENNIRICEENYNTCQAQQEYARHQYETEKKEKEMYSNRVDNMTEEMYLLRLEHLHQLQSKGQNLTTCENNIRICEENYNTSQAQQEYARQQYEIEKNEKKMYSNGVDNMTEEMYLLRLEHLHQLHSKIQDLTTCENKIRICEDFHLKYCTETVAQLNINDEECKENLKKYSVKLAQCEMKGSYAASDLSRCQRDYKECSDEQKKSKKRTLFGFL